MACLGHRVRFRLAREGRCMHRGAPPLLGAEAGTSRVSRVHSLLANLKRKSRRVTQAANYLGYPGLSKGQLHGWG